MVNRNAVASLFFTLHAKVGQANIFYSRRLMNRSQNGFYPAFGMPFGTFRTTWEFPKKEGKNSTFEDSNF
jgi:hypothetical protein